MRDAPARPPASLASARRIAAPASRVPPAVGAAHPPIRARGEGGAVRWPRQAHAARPPPPQRAQRGGAQPRRNPENGAVAGGLDEAAKPWRVSSARVSPRAVPQMDGGQAGSQWLAVPQLGWHVDELCGTQQLESGTPFPSVRLQPPALHLPEQGDRQVTRHAHQTLGRDIISRGGGSGDARNLPALGRVHAETRRLGPPPRPTTGTANPPF